MKESLFNSKIRLTDDLLAIYNALNDKTIFIARSSVDVDDLSNSPARTLEQLKANGFIVEDSVDEARDYISYTRNVQNDTSAAHLIINPTINCNFSCWYCYEQHTKSKMDEETINRVKRLVYRIMTEKRPLQFSFFGGEPLLYYKQVMLPILEYAGHLSEETGGMFQVNMTTNGSLLTPGRIEELKKYNFNGAQITLDGYKATHDRIRTPGNGKGSYDRIVSNIHELVRNGVPATVRINCTCENINDIHNITESFANLPEEQRSLLSFDFQTVWQEGNKSDISDRLNHIVREFVKQGLNAAKSSFREFCYADRRNSCVINYNGDLYKCTAIDFANTQRDGYLAEDGGLIWENGSLEKRLASKLKNKPCRACRILPLCHGGCTKNSLNASDEYCMYNFDEHQIDQVVLDAIERNIQFGRSKKI